MLSNRIQQDKRIICHDQMVSIQGYKTGSTFKNPSV